MPDINNHADYTEYEANVGAFFDREGIDNLSPDTEQDDDAFNEPYFSWRPCDCCGCSLGGDRHDCSGYNPTTKEVQSGYSVCVDCVYYCEYGRLDDVTMDRVGKSAEGKEGSR